MYKLLYQMSAWNIACTEMRPCKMRMPTGPALENYLFDNHSALWVILNQEGAQVHKLLALFVSSQHTSWFHFHIYDQQVGSFDDFSQSSTTIQQPSKSKTRLYEYLVLFLHIFLDLIHKSWNHPSISDIVKKISAPGKFLKQQ